MLKIIPGRLSGLFCLLFGLLSSPTSACTIVMVSGEGMALAGSNEDSNFPLTLIWFTPAAEGSYARVSLGYNMMQNSVQGGMNEMGLFVDGNSLGAQGWVADPSKERPERSILEQLLAKCASVEEVKAYFNTYNVPALDRARIPVMDKSGASMVVEWYQGKVVFLETERPYQIATNFVGSAYTGQDKPCWRYQKAQEILEKKETFTSETLQDALSAAHQEGDHSKTVYSFICDLKKGEITVYNFYDFSESVTFKLEEEIQKGSQEHYLGQLFPDRSSEYLNFLEEGSVKMVEMGYRRNIMTAFIFYTFLKTQYPIAFDRELSIETLSRMAKHLIDQGKIKDAVVFLERNSTEYPGSARSHLELAEAYLLFDRREKAAEAFQKVLVIDPGNNRARQALKGL